MSFLDFIKVNSQRGDAIGDYCEDTLDVIKANPTKIKRLIYKKDFAFLFNLVPFHHVSDESRQAFLDAWKEYRG